MFLGRVFWFRGGFFVHYTPPCAKSYFLHQSFAIQVNSYLEFKFGYRMEIKSLASYDYEEINILRVNSYLEFTTFFLITPPIGRMMHRSADSYHETNQLHSWRCILIWNSQLIFSVIRMQGENVVILLPRIMRQIHVNSYLEFK